MSPYVLVVESDLEMQRRIGDALSEAHYSLAAETEIGWARRSMLIQAPDAVVLNTTLTDGSGFTLAEEIRRSSETEHAPIFFVASTHRGASHAAEAKRRFAPAEYLSTPLDVSRLLASLLEMVPPSEPTLEPMVRNYPGALPPDLDQKRERRQVESAAKHLGEGEAGLRGSLANQPFAHVLQRIYAGRLTGALLLTGEKWKKVVYFENGYPIAVRSNDPAECLGQVLLSQRMISAETLAESLRQMKESKKRQGELLVEMGALSPYNLSRALVLQMEAKLLEVFSWREGRFAFKRGQPGRDQPVRLERSTAALILEGIRRSYDAERMHHVLSPFNGQFVMPSPDRRQRLQDVTSDPNEQRFVDSLDGSVKFEAALSTTMIPIDRARLLLVAMAEAGMVVPAAQPSQRGVEEVPVHDSQPYMAATVRSLEELNAILDVMHHQTHFEVLGVDRDAAQSEVDVAYEGRARDFHPDHFRARPEPVRVVAERIFERLEEAHAVLSDGTARRRYLVQLDRNRTEASADSAAVAGESPQVAAERIYFQGVAHLRARRYRDAAESFRQATALAPAQASYRSALGWALYRQSPADQRAVDSGLTELKRAVETDAKSPWAKVSLGRFFAETGMPDEAIAVFEEVLRNNPGLSDIEEEIRRLKGAS